jgi:hypothetical protein
MLGDSSVALYMAASPEVLSPMELISMSYGKESNFLSSLRVMLCHIEYHVVITIPGL